MTGIGTDQLWAALRQRGAATLTGREGRVCNRRLLKVVDSVVFVDPGDFRCFIPADLTTPFTSHELAVALQHPDNIDHKMTYCLRKMGTLTVVGKRQRARLYALADAELSSTFTA